MRHTFCWIKSLLLLCAAVAHASVIVMQSSNDGPHPSTMDIEVTLPDSNIKVHIQLERTDAFENFPITVVENGVSRTFSSHQVHDASHAHYINVAKKSAISVRHVNRTRMIDGHVVHNGTSYFLKPIGDNQNNKTTIVVKNQTRPVELKSRRKRQTNTAATENTVELHLLLDSTVWNAFMTVYGSESVALTELHYYYTHILNGIDTTFRNIGTPAISVSCIGLTLSKTAADDAWMPTDSNDGSKILDQMETYISDKTADHFMAFTRKDIVGDGNNDVFGMAPIGGTCGSKRVSIIEDNGLQSWGSAAHGLGHNLGSRDDRDGNDCSSIKRNVMTNFHRSFDLTNVGNSYQFSSCSVTYIKKFIEGLGSSSCLRSAQGTRLPELSTSEREGARMTLDQVCRIAHPNGPGKFVMSPTSKANSATICASIYCWTASGSVTSSGGLRAPAGTPCGNKKSCDWTGQCTADSAAPDSDESCFWGDIYTASECEIWKKGIEAGTDSCKDYLKLNCCMTLKGVC